MGQSLQARPRAQENAVQLLDTGEEKGVARSKPERSKDRNNPPHRGEGGRARKQFFVLKRVKAGDKFPPINRAVGRRGTGEVDEVDHITPIELPHQPDFASA
jgi:hypothetical protein